MTSDLKNDDVIINGAMMGTADVCRVILRDVLLQALQRLGIRSVGAVILGARISETGYDEWAREPDKGFTQHGALLCMGGTDRKDQCMVKRKATEPSGETAKNVSPVKVDRLADAFSDESRLCDGEILGGCNLGSHGQRLDEFSAPDCVWLRKRGLKVPPTTRIARPNALPKHFQIPR